MVRIQREPIDVAQLLASVADPEHGGTAAFVGSTRADAETLEVAALDYEAHEEMALSELEAIAREASKLHGAQCAIVHRLGRVDVGQASVAVAASAPHRAEAFRACRHLIDQTKLRAPIWKRSVAGDGDGRWHDGLERAP